MKFFLINCVIAAILATGGLFLFAGDGILNIIKQFAGGTSSAPAAVAAPVSIPQPAELAAPVAAAVSVQPVSKTPSVPLKTDYSAEKNILLAQMQGLAPALKAKKEEYLKVQNQNNQMNKIQRVSADWKCLRCGKTCSGIGERPPSKCIFCSGKDFEYLKPETFEEKDARAQALKTTHDELKSLETQYAAIQSEFMATCKKETEAKAALKQAQAQTGK